MNSETVSKAPPMAICTECDQFRQVHQRNPRILCRNCYLRVHPPKRKKDFCAKCSEYKAIVARGLCRSCYDKLRRSEGLDLSKYPKKS